MASDMTGTLLKLGIVGAAGFAAYKYLQSSGLWGQWFGFSADQQQQLLAYCQGNPSGTFKYTNAQGQVISGGCAQLLAPAPGSPPATQPPSTTPPVTTPPVTTPPVTTPPTTPPASASAIAALGQALNTRANTDKGTNQQGIVMYNLWQWNFIMKELNPSAANLNTSNNAQVVSALQYAQMRSAAGLGLSGLSAIGASFRGTRVPLHLVHHPGDFRVRRIR